MMAIKHVVPIKEADGSSRFWSRAERKLWIATLFCGCAVVYAARTSMPLCILSLSKEFGWDKKQAGSMLSAFYWGYATTQVIGGYMSDRIGGDAVMIATTVVWSLLTFWTPWLIYYYPDKSSLLSFLVLTRVAMGCLQGVFYPAISSLLGKNVHEAERSFCFSMACSGTHVGTLVIGSIGSVLLAHFGWSSVLYTGGFLGMGWVLFLRYYLVAKKRRKALILSVKDMTNGELKKPEPVPWLHLFKHTSFWVMVVSHFCHTWSFHLLLNWMPTYFGETFPNEKGWVFNVVPWMVTIPSTIFAGWLADYLVAKGLTITVVRKLGASVSLGLVGFFCLLVTYTTSYPGALFCMAACMAAGGFHGSCILVNPQDLAPRFAGSVFGVMNMAGAIPGFVAVYIAGYILEVTKSWTLVFTQTAFVCFFGWIIYILFGTGKQII